MQYSKSEATVILNDAQLNLQASAVGPEVNRNISVHMIELGTGKRFSNTTAR